MFFDTAKGGASDRNAGGDEWSIPAAATDTGCERDLNEDRYAVVESPSGLAWIVCDGMGGATGGELAAQLAIDGIRRDLENLPLRPVTQALNNSILEANRIIVLRRQNPAFAAMGTTIVSALFSGVEVAIGHVGDSRAYLIRGSAIQQLTVDHTYVQELVEKGEIDSGDALTHPQAHILTRAIGSEPGLQVTIDRFWIWRKPGEERGDVLLLCSDGLYSHVSDQELLEAVRDNPPQQACVKLVELAKARGGFDNITLAIIPVGGEMRREQPAGYDASKVLAAQKARLEGTHDAPVSFLRNMGMVLVLTLLSSVFVVLAMLYKLST